MKRTTGIGNLLSSCLWRRGGLAEKLIQARGVFSKMWGRWKLFNLLAGATAPAAPRMEACVAVTLLRTVFQLCTVTRATFSKRGPLGNVRTPKEIKFGIRNNTTSSYSNRALIRPSQKKRGIWARIDLLSTQRPFEHAATFGARSDLFCPALVSLPKMGSVFISLGPSWGTEEEFWRTKLHDYPNICYVWRERHTGWEHPTPKLYVCNLCTHNRVLTMSRLPPCGHPKFAFLQITYLTTRTTIES